MVPLHLCQCMRLPPEQLEVQTVPGSASTPSRMERQPLSFLPSLESPCRHPHLEIPHPGFCPHLQGVLHRTPFPFCMLKIDGSSGSPENGQNPLQAEMEPPFCGILSLLLHLAIALYTCFCTKNTHSSQRPGWRMVKLTII